MKDGKEFYISSTKVEAFHPTDTGTRIYTVSDKIFDVQEDFDTVLEWYLKMEGWISYTDISLFNVEEQIRKMNSKPPLIMVE